MSAVGFAPETLAQRFATLGVATFPILVFQDGGGAWRKRPLSPNGHLDATADPQRLVDLFFEYPQANGVGVVTGANGIAVLDIDRHAGQADGYESLAAAGLAIPVSPVRYTSASGAGEHVILATPHGVEISPGELMPGVDVKAGGSWVAWNGDVPERWEFPEAPAWMHRRKTEPPAASGVTVAEWIENNPGEPSGALAQALEALPPHGSPEWSNDKLLRLALRIVEATWWGPGGAAARERFISLYAAGEWATNEYRRAAARAFDRAIETVGIGGPANLQGPAVTIGTEAAEVAPTSAPFQVLTRSDLRNRAKPQWLIAGILQGAGVVIVAGEGGVGKTFLALDWACRIATGEPWQGRNVKRGRVLYVAGEGAEFIEDRLTAWERHNALDVPDDRLLYVDEGFNLSEAETVDYMCEIVIANEIDLVILDTLSQLSRLESENDNAQVASVMRQARAIRQARPGTTVIIVHHMSKGSGAVRGASAIRDNADTVIVAKAKPGSTFLLSTQVADHGKSKNAEPFMQSGFYLHAVAGSAVVECERAADPVTEALAAVLDDGAEHGIGEVLARLGDPSDTMRTRVKRALKKAVDGGAVVAMGSGRNTTYRLANSVAQAA